MILADQICFNLVKTFLRDEGCWAGFLAKTIMALVLSEAESLQFVSTKPFWVNAGPVHSYVLMSDFTTKCVCELEPSDQVLTHNASTRKHPAVAVGASNSKFVLVRCGIRDGKRKTCTRILAASQDGSAWSSRRQLCENHRFGGLV
jgi:3-dehydroquinate synthase class II